MTTIAVLSSGWSVEGAAVSDALPQDEVITVERGGALDPVARAEVGLIPPDAERARALLAAAPGIRWLHTISAGVERLLIPEITGRPDLMLTNNSGAYDVPIAEHVVAMLFAASKRVHAHLATQARHEWKRDLEHTELRDATLVILGLGSIGGELARLASGLGMRVLGVRRDASRLVAGVERIVPPEQLGDLAEEADFLAVTSALTPSTRGLLSEAVIARLRPQAWIVNIARGAIIDEPALIAALRERRIGGAALDVFAVEPLPADSPLWELDNVIITPHVSGSSPRVRERSLALVVENVRRFKAGEPLLNVVDPALGY
ncbi:MAG TPA: D-2-hydroxyacid dehydrogenase [Candidatus Saccharimonadales bacterium]|nr:D-2-hydroxyacid dehydrogenase [Candidatus Saccharimonadales bacterium]